MGGVGEGQSIGRNHECLFLYFFWVELELLIHFRRFFAADEVGKAVDSDERLKISKQNKTGMITNEYNQKMYRNW